jgi:hypothetical protein
MTIAPLIFGFIVDRYTLSSVFYSAGGLGLIAVIVCYTLTRAAARLTPVTVAPVEKPVVTESTRPSAG